MNVSGNFVLYLSSQCLGLDSLRFLFKLYFFVSQNRFWQASWSPETGKFVRENRRIHYQRQNLLQFNANRHNKTELNDRNI